MKTEARPCVERSGQPFPRHRAQRQEWAWLPRAAVFCLGVLLAPLARSHPGPGIVVDSKGQVYFVHPVRHRIMKVDAAGNLTIFVQGEEGKKLSLPHHLVLDRQDNLYSVGDRDGVIWRIAPDAETTQVYPTAYWFGIGFIGFGGDPFTLDAQGDIFCVNHHAEKYSQVVKIASDGRITILAGGEWGFADGEGADVRFGELHSAGFAWSPDGYLYLTDSQTYVRKISPSGTVTTLADGSGKKLQFKGALGLACDIQGNIYVADRVERRIYRVISTGTVSALAGSGRRGGDDGPVGTATFEEPVGVAASRDGTIYVLDYVGENPRVRKISPAGMVTTIAATKGQER